MAKNDAKNGCSVVGALIVIIFLIGLFNSQRDSLHNQQTPPKYSAPPYVPPSRLAFTSTDPKVVSQINDSLRQVVVHKNSLQNDGEGPSSVVDLNLRFEDINQTLQIGSFGPLEPSTMGPDDDIVKAIDISALANFPKRSADLQLVIAFHDSRGEIDGRRGELSWVHRFRVTDWMDEEERPNHKTVWEWITQATIAISIIGAAATGLHFLRKEKRHRYLLVGWLMTITITTGVSWLICVGAIPIGRATAMALALFLINSLAAVPSTWKWLLGGWGAFTFMGFALLRSYARLGSRRFRWIAAILLLFSLLTVIAGIIVAGKRVLEYRERFPPAVSRSETTLEGGL